jgi:nucleotide-binding universal stress UspA family protein
MSTTESAESAVTSTPIVVGVDGSEPARQALRWAAAEARHRSRPIRIVLAWDLDLADVTGEQHESAADRRERLARQTLEQVLDGERESLAGLDADARVVRGRPVEALLAAAEGACMLVVGARGHGGFEKLLLGSVSQQCVQHATGTVVVVR